MASTRRRRGNHADTSRECTQVGLERGGRGSPAVLSSLQTFLRYATRAEGHRIAALRYETLRREMAEKLALPRAARGQPDGDLESVRQRMDRYAKESPTIGEWMWGKLTSTFQLSTVPPDPSRRGEAIVIPEAPVDARVREGGESGR